MADRLANYEDLRGSPWSRYSSDGLRSLLTWLAVEWFWGEGMIVDASKSDFVFDVLVDATELRRLYMGTDIRKNTRKVDLTADSGDALPKLGVDVEVLVLSGDSQHPPSDRFIRELAGVLILGRSLVLITCSRAEQGRLLENWNSFQLLESFDYGMLLGTKVPEAASSSNAHLKGYGLAIDSRDEALLRLNSSASNLQSTNVAGLHLALQNAYSEMLSQIESLSFSENSLVVRVAKLQDLLIVREAEIRRDQETRSSRFLDWDRVQQDLQHWNEVAVSLREKVQDYEAAYDDLRFEIEVLKREKRKLWEWCSSEHGSAMPESTETDSRLLEDALVCPGPQVAESRLRAVLSRLIKSIFDARSQ